MKTVLSAFISGFIPIAVEGGYDFVDVRDVAHIELEIYTVRDGSSNLLLELKRWV